MDSILTSVKKVLGIGEDYNYFDVDLIMHINTVFSILNQLGCGPEDGFAIEDDSAVWSDFLPDGMKLEMVKTYVYQKVRLIFDPPLGSAVIESVNRSISELEWRILNVTDFQTEAINEEEG